MKYPCDMVKDLLPLYHDDVCSDSSKKIVEEHLSECDSCKTVMKKIDDKTYDNRLQQERDDVVGHHTQKVKRKSFLVGLCVSAILTIPILVCLIVNIATGHALDWFFIVLTSLMVLASVTAVPLIVEKGKGVWTLGSFTGSLILLLLVCCIYNSGNWFFVATIPILFGMSVIFLPFLIHQIPLKGFASRNKGLIVMAVDTILLYAIIIVCGLYSRYGYNSDYWRISLLNTTVNMLFPWILFVTIRYFKVNKLIKWGICVIASGLYLSMIHDIIYWITDGIMHIRFTDANLLIWNGKTTSENIFLLLLLLGCIIGGTLLTVGIIRRRNGEVKTRK